MQVSVKEAALSLEVDEETIYRWIRQGEIPAHRINEEFRFNGSELLEWATKRGMRISLGSFEGRDSAGSEGPSLLEALELGGVARGIAGVDPATVLREVVEALALPDDVDREYLFQVMMARESLGSTGIGDGIAIPHVRNPVVLDVAKPSVTLCFLDRPIDFHAIDGKPVDIMFAIVSPTVRVHLHLLSRLGLVLRDEAFKRLLKARAGDAELLAALALAEATIAPSAGEHPARKA
jgi:PTS system nitrogen regulatory IIA component